MPFTPSEIKSKEFTRVKNGLEPTEVANYLDQLSTEIERLKEDKNNLKKSSKKEILILSLIKMFTNQLAML